MGTSQRDETGHFGTDRLTDDLRGHSVRGGVLTLAGQGTRFALSVGSIVVLGRLLTPDDFGVVAMSMAAIMILGGMRGLGLGESTVQRAEVGHETVSTLFWIGSAAGVAVAAIAAGLAPLLAWFYDDPRVLGVTLAIAPVLLSGFLLAQHQALLQRQMRFGAIAAVEIIAMAIAVAAAITAAVLGAGYWALVLMHVTASFALCAGMWTVCRWRPGRPRMSAPARSMLRFGVHLSAATMLTRVVRRADKIVVGWASGAGVLGYYSRAFNLLTLPLDQVTRPMTSVVVPAMSRLADDPVRQRLFFRRAVLFTASIGLPAVGLMLTSAEEIVRVVLGPQWGPAAPVLRLLAIAGLVWSVDVALDWVYIASGRTGRRLRWSLAAAAAMAAGLAAGVVLGGRAGGGMATALWVAGLVSAVTVLVRAAEVPSCIRGTAVRTVDVLDALWRPACATAVGMACVAARDVLWDAAGPFLGLAMDAAVMGAVYALAWVALPGGRPMAVDLASVARDLAPGRFRPAR